MIPSGNTSGALTVPVKRVRPTKRLNLVSVEPANDPAPEVVAEQRATGRESRAPAESKRSCGSARHQRSDLPGLHHRQRPGVEE